MPEQNYSYVVSDNCFRAFAPPLNYEMSASMGTRIAHCPAGPVTYSFDKCKDAFDQTEEYKIMTRDKAIEESRKSQYISKDGSYKGYCMSKAVFAVTHKHELELFPGNSEKRVNLIMWNLDFAPYSNSEMIGPLTFIRQNTFYLWKQQQVLRVAAIGAEKGTIPGAVIGGVIGAAGAIITAGGSTYIAVAVGVAEGAVAWAAGAALVSMALPLVFLGAESLSALATLGIVTGGIAGYLAGGELGSDIAGLGEGKRLGFVAVESPYRERDLGRGYTNTGFGLFVQKIMRCTPFGRTSEENAVAALEEYKVAALT